VLPPFTTQRYITTTSNTRMISHMRWEEKENFAQFLTRGDRSEVA